MAVSLVPVYTLEQLVACPICQDVFRNPVSTGCGHSFCRQCLVDNRQVNGRNCPLCKQSVATVPEVNISLRSVAEELRKSKEASDVVGFSGAPGEVACDSCTGRRLKALKSCLVCLASYCEAHLEPHASTERLKGHKLVEPVEDLDSRACLTHGRPLELYNRKREECVCALCVEEGQDVVSVETEWERKKAELQDTKSDLTHRIKEKERKADEINASAGVCRDHLEGEIQTVEEVFKALAEVLDEAERTANGPLEDRIHTVEAEALELTQELQRETDQLKKTISELDTVSALEDHVLFLQSFPSLPDLEDEKDWKEMAFDTSFYFGTLRSTSISMMEKIEQGLEKLTFIELERIRKFGVDVQLDQQTAYPRLVLSDDGKQVRDGVTSQSLSCGLDSFDCHGSVLALNKLVSGKSYWEVEVGNKTGWDLGITKGGANRKGQLELKPVNGYWAIVHFVGKQYAAMSDPPTRLSPKVKPKKVGVFVDYEEGLVSFYDVETRSHIYSFTKCGFTGVLYPYFSPHLRQGEVNSSPLIISPVKCR